MRLKSPLSTANTHRMRDTTISAGLAPESFLLKMTARPRLTAQRIAENTLARSPGITTTYGLRNASCIDVRQNTIQAAFSPLEDGKRPPEKMWETLSLIAPPPRLHNPRRCLNFLHFARYFLSRGTTIHAQCASFQSPSSNRSPQSARIRRVTAWWTQLAYAGHGAQNARHCRSKLLQEAILGSVTSAILGLGA